MTNTIESVQKAYEELPEDMDYQAKVKFISQELILSPFVVAKALAKKGIYDEQED